MNEAATSPTKPAPKKKKKSRMRLYLIIGVIVVVALGVLAAGKGRKEKTTMVTTEKAVRKDIIQLVTATGKIQPETEVKISPEVAGEIIELPVREGQPVQKGDLLLRIKRDSYEAQLDQYEADLAAARANSLDTKATMLQAEADLKRNEELYSRKLISDTEILSARTTAESAKAAYEYSLAQIRRAEGQLKQANDQLEKTTIYAPMDGTISVLASEVGERVVATGQFSGTEVMRVADLDNMEVRVNVNENAVVDVKIDDKARIRIDAFPDRVFNGVVKEIASTATTTGANTQEEVTNFEVRIRISDRDVPLRPGMSATADIETRSVKDVVAVPIQSVTVRTREGSKTMEQIASDRAKEASENKGEGAATAVNERERRERERSDRAALQRVVYVVRDGKAKEVPVQTGIADTSHMEIKSGVEVGDEIVSGSFSVIREIKDDTAVTIKPAVKTEKK